jgi:uncharacterized protein
MLVPSSGEVTVFREKATNRMRFSRLIESSFSPFNEIVILSAGVPSARRVCVWWGGNNNVSVTTELSAMPVGLLTLEIFIPDAHSLKDKRQVLRSLKDRLRARFNVAVAELDHQDTWQRAQVGVVILSNDAAHLEQSLQAVFAEAENLLGRDLVDHNLEVL